MFDVNKDSGTVRCYGEIGDCDGEIGVEHFMQAFDALDGADMTIQLKSDGGQVDTGMSIYNQIAAYPGKVTVEIDAMAASIATVFPMAADTVRIHPASMMMVHRAWTIALGNVRDFREMADILDLLDAQLAATYAKRTGKSEAYWLAKMDKNGGGGTWFSADEALTEGLVDEIILDGPRNRAPAAPRNAIARPATGSGVATCHISRTQPPLALTRPSGRL